MGWCKLPGGDWEPGWSSEGCAAAGGVYSESKPPEGDCFLSTILTRSLAQTILELGRTYQVQMAFRELLQSSAVGKRMVILYYKHNPTMQLIARHDPLLLAESINTWLSVLEFVTATTVVASRNSDASPEYSKLRFNKQLHDRVVQLLNRFGEGSKDKRFQLALKEVEQELSRYVGLTPGEALKTLRRKARR